MYFLHQVTTCKSLHVERNCLLLLLDVSRTSLGAVRRVYVHIWGLWGAFGGAVRRKVGSGVLWVVQRAVALSEAC